MKQDLPWQPLSNPIFRGLGASCPRKYSAAGRGLQLTDFMSQCAAHLSQLLSENTGLIFPKKILVPCQGWCITTLAASSMTHVGATIMRKLPGCCQLSLLVAHRFAKKYW